MVKYNFLVENILHWDSGHVLFIQIQFCLLHEKGLGISREYLQKRISIIQYTASYKVFSYNSQKSFNEEPHPQLFFLAFAKNVFIETEIKQRHKLQYIQLRLKMKS